MHAYIYFSYQNYQQYMEGIIDITMTNSMNIVAYCRHDYHYLQYSIVRWKHDYPVMGNSDPVVMMLSWYSCLAYVIEIITWTHLNGI